MKVYLSHRPQDVDLFGKNIIIDTQIEHAHQVLKRIEQQIGKRGVQQLMYVFLSDHETMPTTFLRIVRLMLAQPRQSNILADCGHPDVIVWAQ